MEKRNNGVRHEFNDLIRLNIDGKKEGKVSLANKPPRVNNAQQSDLRTFHQALV